VQSISAWRRAAAYLWAAPVSLLGLALALPAGIGWGQARMRDGLLEVTGGLASKLLACPLPGSGPVMGLALGHVLVGRTAEGLAALASHERVHVAQAERWGILFLVAYPLASLWAWSRGGHPYRDNAFERQARQIAGY
jgi:hypothetical protein